MKTSNYTIYIEKEVQNNLFISVFKWYHATNNKIVY